MSWGRRPGGGMYGPVKDISAIGISKGLSEDWYSKDSIRKRERKEIQKGNYWDIIDNPLYEVAAGALGYDWDDWINESQDLVGTSPNSGSVRVRAMVTPGRAGRTRRNIGPNSMTRTTPAVAAKYEWMTRDEADERGLEYELAQTTRYKNKKTGEIVNELTPPWLKHRRSNSLPGSSGAITEFLQAKRYEGWEDDWEELRDWGVTDEGVTEQLEEMSGWLSEIVNINDNLHPIIAEGPQGKHYGIEGDIWEHYGLDKEPEPPKELDWDSYDKKMNLAKAVKSHVTYSTPEGIDPIDLHSDN